MQRYFEEQLAFFDRWLPDDATGQPADEAPVQIFVMGGGSGRRTELGKLDHGGGWRDEQEWPLARAVPTTLHLHSDGGAARARRRAAGAEPRTFTYDPDDPVPTIGGLFCAVGELPSGDGEIEPMWARLLNPALLLRNIMTPGPADQKEAAEYFTAREPYQRLSERQDVLVYQTEPLAEPVEVTGRVAVELWIASSAVDTDFTAKLIDVYPPNEDYPEGYDLLLNDTIIRTRYREGFDREVLLVPGHALPGDDRCCRRPRTSSPRATGSGSTSPRRTSPGSSATRTPASRSAATPITSSRSRRSSPTPSAPRTSSCP